MFNQNIIDFEGDLQAQLSDHLNQSEFEEEWDRIVRIYKIFVNNNFKVTLLDVERNKYRYLGELSSFHFSSDYLKEQLCFYCVADGNEIGFKISYRNTENHGKVLFSGISLKMILESITKVGYFYQFETFGEMLERKYGRNLRSYLIELDGKITRNKSLIDELVTRGYIIKDGDTLFVDMKISDQPGCICCFCFSVEYLESLTRDLLSFFQAEKIVYHGVKIPSEPKIIEVDSGDKSELHSCCTYPIIKGLNMSWEFNRHRIDLNKFF